MQELARSDRSISPSPATAPMKAAAREVDAPRVCKMEEVVSPEKLVLEFFERSIGCTAQETAALRKQYEARIRVSMNSDPGDPPPVTKREIDETVKRVMQTIEKSHPATTNTIPQAELDAFDDYSGKIGQAITKIAKGSPPSFPQP